MSSRGVRVAYAGAVFGVRSTCGVPALCVVLFLTFGCGSGSPEPQPGPASTIPIELYASEVVAFEPGTDAGFGEEGLPDVVLGPPSGNGTHAGSLDVLSLGKDGRIVLGFGAGAVVDGDGPDFVVFENAFWPGGDATAVFAEPGEVSVSLDGEVWETFACNVAGDERGAFVGCAGWTPTLAYEPGSVVPLDPALCGGDAFDLAEVGLERARFVRVRDVSGTGSAPTAGFDLDAIGIVHREESEP